MKKILLSAVLCLICALQVSAQTFDEEMLEGTWELQTNGVDYNDYIGSIKKLVIGDLADKEKKTLAIGVDLSNIIGHKEQKILTRNIRYLKLKTKITFLTTLLQEMTDFT